MVIIFPPFSRLLIVPFSARPARAGTKASGQAGAQRGSYSPQNHCPAVVSVPYRCPLWTRPYPLLPKISPVALCIMRLTHMLCSGPRSILAYFGPGTTLTCSASACHWLYRLAVRSGCCWRVSAARSLIFFAAYPLTCLLPMPVLHHVHK